MTYTVRQLAVLAGVTPRTLHYYDEIGLLQPSFIGNNGYRYYDEAAALRLQQILFFRELGMGLDKIRIAVDSADFDVEAALRGHRDALRNRVGRLEQLIATVDKTIMHLRGQRAMSAKELFEGFDDETQARYEAEVAEKYGSHLVEESRRRWKGYTGADKERILAEGGSIYRDLAMMIDRDPADAEVQAAIGRWHDNIRAFYEPTPEIMRGLAQGYEEHPEFAAFYAAIHPDLPGFLRRAIEIYADSLEQE